MTALSQKSCQACRGQTAPLGEPMMDELRMQVPGWEYAGGHHHITRTFKFHDFATALAFVNRIGALADTEGHHPDIHLSWGKAQVDLCTHKVNGLTESDFIMAAKIDDLLRTEI
jgi:4a-hydroxytetrahydrobiopterin dehydratase